MVYRVGVMPPVLFLILLISSIVKFCEPYNIRVEDPDSYRYEKKQDDQENYEYKYSVFDANSKSKNQIYHQETGTLKQSNTAQDDVTVAVSGNYYYRNNGYIYKVTYEADENGFRPRVEIISEKDVSPIFQSPGLVQPDPITSDALKTLQGG